MRSLVLVLLVSCGGVDVPAGPRPAGIDSTAFVGDAELAVRYRYEPLPGSEVRFHVDASASQADVGPIAFELTADGFELASGERTWQGSIAAGGTATHTTTWRAVGDPAPTLTVVTRQVEGDVELARDAVRFVIDEGGVRECRSIDAACAQR
jgi:hypothetical protein